MVVENIVFSIQNCMTKKYYTCPYLYFLKNHIWPWNLPLTLNFASLHKLFIVNTHRLSRIIYLTSPLSKTYYSIYYKIFEIDQLYDILWYTMYFDGHLGLLPIKHVSPSMPAWQAAVLWPRDPILPEYTIRHCIFRKTRFSQNRLFSCRL